MTDTLAPPGPLADPAARAREHRSWYFYDWANSAFVTTTATVLFGPYLTAVAETAACGEAGTPQDPCHADLSVLGVPIAAGSVAAYAVTAATLLSALLLPLVGALADRTSRKRHMLAGFAWTGAAAAASMFFVTGANWALGVGLLVVASVCLGSSLVVYDAVLVQIAHEDERDRVSSRGWAFGYLGGGILLAANLALVTLEPFGLERADTVRVSLLSAGVWWALWTFVPFRGLRDRPVTAAVPVDGGHGPAGLARQAFSQLTTTLRHARGYPQTLLFLVAYLLYNDGVQTVVYAASIYGNRELGLAEDVLIVAILMVQFIAFGGALLFGRLAERFGSKVMVLFSLVVWTFVVSCGYFLPTGEIVPFLALAVGIGVVLGGSQALSRSLFSLLVPRGNEAEYFSLYQAAERGTSWFGTLAFGVAYQLTDSYRSAILVLIVFFVAGFALLARVDLRRGIMAAGNELPTVLRGRVSS
ncbi:UMF1 family MFS transporter [Haloactinopolyspora alba]|uniref:UMF1 family MFS transporter n=1 Tax=Haloactinopolyspora alba TaxID=648780 RepID=A0A2P8DYB8_9ACTN|nr:MFS transporter [Haloactinopolyspora alba]PSL02182.1 UMF1 family MFS transporter [Haloactinopolyspora alba]